MLIPGVHQYNGSGANIDHYQQWRNAVTLDDTLTFLALDGRIAPLRLRAALQPRDLGRRRVGSLANFIFPSVVIDNQSLLGYPEFNLGEAVPTIGSRINRLAKDLHTLFSTFTKIHGNHSLKFGSDYRLVRYNSANQGTSAVGSFSPTFTQGDPFTSSSAR